MHSYFCGSESGHQLSCAAVSEFMYSHIQIMWKHEEDSARSGIISLQSVESKIILVRAQLNFIFDQTQSEKFDDSNSNLTFC